MAMRFTVLPIVLLLFLQSFRASAREGDEVRLSRPGGVLAGTLLLPKQESNGVVALIIAGSGPTDRDGNGPGARNNSLRFLAERLSSIGIASLRYDKRGLAKSPFPELRRDELRLDDLVDDAAAWIAWLRRDSRFSSVMVLGHSEGSLIGMLAAQRGGVSTFVSVGGAARRISDILRWQLAGKLPPDLVEENERILRSLESGQRPERVSTPLAPLYHSTVQQYLISEFKWIPKDELAKLKIPILLIQGGADAQVPSAEAQALAESNSHAEIRFIPDMDHLMKNRSTISVKPTYDEPDSPINPEVAASIWQFLYCKGFLLRSSNAGKGRPE